MASPVTDAVIDQETPDGSGRIVVDAEIDSEAFARLLRASSVAASWSNAELPLLSHSAVLSAASDVTLDYWWSLLGLDEVEGTAGAPQRRRLPRPRGVCRRLAMARRTRPIVEAEPSLPMLADLDAVWELARQRRPASSDRHLPASAETP